MLQPAKVTNLPDGKLDKNSRAMATTPIINVNYEAWGPHYGHSIRKFLCATADQRDDFHAPT